MIYKNEISIESMEDKEYLIKVNKLTEMINEYANKDIVLAFSGGVDSGILLKLACDALKDTDFKVYAINVKTKLHPKSDNVVVKSVVKETGAKLIVLDIDELDECQIENNPIDRCYRCKLSIFKKIKELAKSLGTDVIIEGTNEDDLHVYRPGIKALNELGIISPLAVCKLTKKDVRKLAKNLGLSVADRPSNPCMATRFPYNTPISYDDMEKIERGENFIKELGFYNVRLRIHKDVVRIEVDKNDILKLMENKEEITRYLKLQGFRYITVDLEGFRSGSMD